MFRKYKKNKCGCYPNDQLGGAKWVQTKCTIQSPYNSLAATQIGVLARELGEIKVVKFLVFADSTPLEKELHGIPHALDYVVNPVVMIITTAGSIAAIVDFIYAVVRDNDREKKVEESRNICQDRV